MISPPLQIGSSVLFWIRVNYNPTFPIPQTKSLRINYDSFFKKSYTLSTLTVKYISSIVNI